MRTCVTHPLAFVEIRPERYLVADVAHRRRNGGYQLGYGDLNNRGDQPGEMVRNRQRPGAASLGKQCPGVALRPLFTCHRGIDF